MKKQILLVEDDREIGEAIRDFFKGKASEELELTLASDGEEGREYIMSGNWDLILLDVMLPGIDGFSLCRAARRTSDVPIIFLTARGREEDILYGYDLGCDDYIVKPFSIATLLAKVQALLKRATGNITSELLRCGRITMNPRTYLVTVNDIEVELPPKEYEILFFLMKHKGVVCTREQLLLKLWGYDFEGDERVLNNHIKKLRAALGDAGSQVKTIITKGYKLVE